MLYFSLILHHYDFTPSISITPIDMMLQGKYPIWVFLFLVSPKHSQFVDHSMTIKNYVFYSSNPFKYNFKEKLQYPIQNIDEQEILNTFDNSFRSFTSQKGTVSS
jgi:hypothetical protein